MFVIALPMHFSAMLHTYLYRKGKIVGGGKDVDALEFTKYLQLRRRWV